MFFITIIYGLINIQSFNQYFESSINFNGIDIFYAYSCNK